MLEGLGAFADGVHNGVLAGGAVGFEDGAVETQQGCAAAGVGVGAAHDGAEGVFDQHAAEQALGIFGDFILEPAQQALGEIFQRFKDDVADKTVADDDIHAVMEEVVPLDVADKIQVRPLAKFAGAPKSIRCLCWVRCRC